MGSDLLSKEEKERILRTLEVDAEFRYAVAGLIGLSEILRRLDRHEEQIVKIWERLAKIDEEIAKLREDMLKGFERHDAELAKLREDMMKGFERHDRELAKLREDFLKMAERIDKMDERLSRVERTLEKLTLDIEEEARSIIRYRLRSEIGLDVEISSLHLPDMEVNIYGCRGDVCVVGEASVRAGVNLLGELLSKVGELKKRYPDKLGKKTILVIYTSLAMPELVEEAKKHGVWILKATGDYYKPNLAELLSQ